MQLNITITALLRNLSKLSFLVLWSGILTATSWAQSSTQADRGFKPAGSYAIGDIENINNYSGNLSLHIPIASLPKGRGGNPGAGVGLNYNSKLFETYTFPDNSYGPLTYLQASAEGGWTWDFNYRLKVEDRYHNVNLNSYPQCPAPEVTDHVKTSMVFPDGSEHSFIAQGYNGYGGYDRITPNGQVTTCGSPYFYWTYGTVTYYTTDGTYLRLDVFHDTEDSNWQNNPWTLYFPDGSRITYNEGGVNIGKQRFYDRNNNYVELSSITWNGQPASQIKDEFNRSIIVQYDSVTGNTNVYQDGVGGGMQLQWVVKWTNSTVVKTYDPLNLFDSSHYSTMITSFSSVQEIDLPSQAGQLAYNFTYNGDGNYPTHSTGYGEISSITLPSGAKTTYQYWKDNADYSIPDYILQNYASTKTLSYRAEYDGLTGTSAPLVTEKWTYIPGNQNSIATITGPNGSVSKEYFNSSFYALPSKSELPDGTVIERIWQQNWPYASGVSPSGGGTNTYVKTEYRSLKDANGMLSKTAIKDYLYDKNGNLTQAVEYDWVPYSSVSRGGAFNLPTAIPASAVVKRVSVNTYASPTPVASDSTSYNANTYNQPTSPRLKNAVVASEVRSSTNTADVLSRNENVYDNATTTGNVITQRSWDSTKGGLTPTLSAANAIIVAMVYDEFGNVTKRTDANGNVTKMDYPITGSASSGGIPARGVYPTLIITGENSTDTSTIKRTANLQYDWWTGLVTQATDADNGITTKTTYDVFGRPTLVEEGGSGSPLVFLRQTSTEYSDPLRRVIVRADKDTKGDGKLISVQHYDQLGRTRLSRTIENGVAADATDETKGIKVQTRYFSGDYNGTSTANPNVYTVVSNPYRANYSYNAAAEPTMGWTRSKSDQAGRHIETQSYSGTDLPAPFGTNTTNKGLVITNYDASKVRVTDQAGKQRTSETDGLGRLINVWEAPNSENYLTTYTYDALDNLLQVSQTGLDANNTSVTQNRYFAYNSLKRLLRAKNVEQGNFTTSTTINSRKAYTDPLTSNANWSLGYSYDNNGNLLEKSDANNLTTMFAYDGLNRVTSKSYSSYPSGTANVLYFYDSVANGKGKFAYNVSYNTETNGTLTYNYDQINNYDKLGRATSKTQNFLVNPASYAWQPYTTTATYNLAGGMTSQTYPSGHTVNYAYDEAARTISFTGNLGDGASRNYSTQMTYLPGGQLTKETFGTTTTLYQRLNYNTRQQLFAVRVGTDSNAALDVNPQTAGLGDYNGWGSSWDRGMLLWHYGNEDMTVGWGRGGTDNNGNVLRSHHYIPSGGGIYVDDYEYDNLNRLKKDTGWYNVSYVQAFDYDRWGNRTINQTLTTNSADINKKLFTVTAANNRLGVPTTQIGAMSYDNVGNLISDTYTNPAAGGAMEYDADNHMTSAVNGSHKYRYNAEGKRVRRIIAGQGEFWMVYGIGGELVAEYNASTSIPAASNPSKEYGYRNGQMLVMSDSAETDTNLKFKWLIQDYLGSTRMEIGLSGAANAVVRHDYLPFGEELKNTMRVGNGYGTATKTKQKFTGYERDEETGLDYAQARYYSNVQGRFTSFDPLLSSARLASPQTWNRYTYTLNNPLKYTDPFGLYNFDASAGGDATDAELEATKKNKKLGKDERNAAKQALERRKRFRDGIARAQAAANGTSLSAEESAKVNATITSFGTENDNNGVTVGGGILANNIGGAQATPNFSYNPQTNSWSTTVSVIIDDSARGDSFALAIIHEGQHVADSKAMGEALNRLHASALGSEFNRTRYDKEFRAYYVESLAAQGLGQSWAVGARQTQIWNNSWAEADRATLRTAAINDHLANSPTYRENGQGLSPENQGSRYLGQ